MSDGTTARRGFGRRLLIGGCFVAGLLVVASGDGSALDARQEQTPLAGSPAPIALAGLPVVPDAAECTVAPLPYADLATAVASAATPGSAPPSAGQPAGTIEIDASIMTLRTQIACVNGGDLPRALALTGGGYLAQVIGPVGLPTGEQYAALGTPVPRSTDGAITLVAVSDVVALPDGTLSARVVTATGDVTTTSVVTLTPAATSPTGWLITGQERVSRVDSEGTPVA